MLKPTISAGKEKVISKVDINKVKMPGDKYQ